MELNKIYCGDNSTVLKDFPDECIDAVITSPPYNGLRKYKGFEFNIDKLIPQLYRVLKPGGVVVWVVNDAVEKGSETLTSYNHALKFKEFGFNCHDTMIYEKNSSSFPAKRTGNRYTQIFEFMFVFSKGNPKANLLCDKYNVWEGWISFGQSTYRNKEGELVSRKKKDATPRYSPRNNIWRYNTGKGFTTKDAIATQHPALFPEDLATDNILSWTKIGDTILDPFCGSGTTCKMAYLYKRNYIGIDIAEDYCKISTTRIKNYINYEQGLTNETVNKKISEYDYTCRIFNSKEYGLNYSYIPKEYFKNEFIISLEYKKKWYILYSDKKLSKTAIKLGYYTSIDDDLVLWNKNILINSLFVLYEGSNK